MSNHHRNRRYIRDDITRLVMARLEICLDQGQRFYETEKTYEIRETQTDTCVKSVPKDEVITVVTREL